MLCVMTFNVGAFFAVITGLTIGNFYVNPLRAKIDSGLMSLKNNQFKSEETTILIKQEKNCCKEEDYSKI